MTSRANPTASQAHDVAYVWTWLPGDHTPVVAGRIDDVGPNTTFTYGRSYLDRADAISLYQPELPLEPGPQVPLSGGLAGCLADAGPDAWGRRVIEHRRAAADHDLSPIGLLLASGSNRIGALDFQPTPDVYTERGGGEATLEQLHQAAELVEASEPLPTELDDALLHGSSVGGARPKALLSDGDTPLIAKFSSTSDSYPVVQAEFVAMELARRCGLRVATVRLTETLGRHVLLVERFDRSTGGTRRPLVSALTILELHDADGMAGRYGTYTDLADHIRASFTQPAATLRELFTRIAFNILIGNTDDHARNHAAFWDGRSNALTLTPAYDLCPQVRNVGEVAQAMAYGKDGQRTSQLAPLVAAADLYGLSANDARDLIANQVDEIRANWEEVCDLAKLGSVARQQLMGRQFLNPYVFYGW